MKYQDFIEIHHEHNTTIQHINNNPHLCCNDCLQAYPIPYTIHTDEPDFEEMKTLLKGEPQ